METAREIIEFSRDIDTGSFYHALEIYLKKPQVVNRKLSCSSNLALVKIKNKVLCESFEETFKNVILSKQPLETLKNSLIQCGIEHEFSEKFEILKHRDEELHQLISLDKIISKGNAVCHQIVFIDTANNSASFYTFGSAPKVLPLINYTLQFKENRLSLIVSGNDFENEATNWLRFILLKKLHNWMESFDENGNADDERIESHTLIDDEEYTQLYAHLKEKYGRKLESIWTEEATDPKKFIYEDIAICAYLLIFWKRQRRESGNEKKQSFVDFGCGNGLLVYLLAQEGHRGYGVDLRKRNIWDKYQPQVDLYERTWTPESNFEDDVDWIIGNHSDELSPWVPVVAYRSSFSCNYFLLPCCAYQFSGAKFQRRGTSKSPYMSYIDFLKEISSVCGFKSTLVDRLKIPSTKRICLVGMGRSHEIERFGEQCEAIDNFIKESNEQQFVPREKVQTVRNCTKTDRKLTEKIVKIIFDALMADEKFCEEYGDWNCGSEMLVSDAVNLIPKDDLKKLKSECGGLQTLLKNKHQIFLIQGGSIKIRKPKRIGETKISERAQKKNVIKSSPCYFHLHHRQKCPLQSAECCYRHE